MDKFCIFINGYTIVPVLYKRHVIWDYGEGVTEITEPNSGGI